MLGVVVVAVDDGGDVVVLQQVVKRAPLLQRPPIPVVQREAVEAIMLHQHDRLA